MPPTILSLQEIFSVETNKLPAVVNLYSFSETKNLEKPANFFLSLCHLSRDLTQQVDFFKSEIFPFFLVRNFRY